MKRRVLLVLIILASAGCSAPQPQMPITPPQDVATSPVARQALPPRPVRAPTPDTAKSSAIAAPVVPPGTLYVCVVDSKGERHETAIEFASRVAELCRKHPEMSVCQYEREVCRSHGGRVFASNGTEITRLTEAEYDKRVTRVRFRAD